MGTYIISYDLNEPEKNYPQLIEQIKGFFSWCHLHRSVWLVETYLTSEQVFNALRPYIDSNDEIYVGQITRYSSIWQGSSARIDAWIGPRG